MKKRKITKSAVTNIFRFVSCHKPDPVTVEGYNEFIACHYFEFPPLVIYFEAQPQKFEFPIEGTNRPLIYTPDFLVRLHNQQEVYFEIKPYEITFTDEFSQRWELLQKTFVEIGLRLELVTDRQLTRGEMAENLKLVHRYMNRESNTAEQENILKLISNSTLSVSSLSEQLQLQEVVIIPYLLNLVAKKQLFFPLYAPLDINTVFQKPLPLIECRMDKVFEQILPVPDHITHDEFKEAFRKEVKQRLDEVDSYEHLDALPEREREQAIFRWKVLSKVSGLCNGVFSNQRLASIYNELETEFAEKTPSISSIKRWAKIYDESGRSIKALSPNISERGNKAHRLSIEMGKAISYTQKQWPKLIRYLDDGQLNIDNNRAERAVKPFVIGRKAWLFANTKTGAKASAALYSLVETAKINGLEPYHYLTQLFEQLPTVNTPDELAKLLPY